MRKDILINVNSENNKVKIDNKTLGITSENLQGKIIFKPEPFVDGVCRLYVDGKGSILMDKQEDCYTVNILSSLLTEDSLDVCFKITEPETEDGIPIFCSKIMHFRVLETIDSSSTIPEDYPSWEQVLDSMMAKVEQMESDADDRLDEVVGQIQDLTSAYNSNATNKTNEFNTNATNKTTAFNQNYASKVTEIDGAVNSAKTELDDYTEDKKDEIDGSVDDLKSELDTYETAKEGELDSHTSTKKTELNTYTNSKKSDLDDYEETKETALNTLAGNLTSAFNSNANSKTSDFNDNATSKTGDFNTNATNKTSAYDENASTKLGAYNTNHTTKLAEYNSNATSKVSDYNTNATTKTSEFDQNASDKTDDFDDNASAKITAFNDNATAKIAEYDAHVSELQSQVDDLTTLVETELESNEVEGTEIDVSDSAEYRGRIEVKGNTEQKQLGGKSVLDPSTIGTGTINGINYSYDENTQEITLNGTCTKDNTLISFVNTNIIASASKTTFCAYCVDGSISGYGTLRFYDADYAKNCILYINELTKGNYTLKQANASYEAVNNNFRFNAGAVCNNFKIKVMVTDSTDTTYEPYCGGQPSPNPDYPQEIKVVTGDNVIKHVGKNFCGLKDQTITKAGVTFIIKDGVITANGTYTANTLTQFENEDNLVLDGNYTVKTFPVSGSASTAPNFNVKNSDGTTLANSVATSGSSVTFLVEKSSLICGIYAQKGTTFDNFKLKAQIEKGTTPNPYEPYREESFEVNLGKNLFDKDNANIINAGVSLKVISTSEYNRLLYIPVKSSTTYTIQRRNEGDVNRFRVGSCPVIPANNVSVPNSIENDNATNITITTGVNDKYLVVMYYRTYETVLTEQQILDSIQIEEGSTATSYSKYFTPIELCKIGGYSDILFKNEVGDENYNAELEEGAWYKKKVIDKKVLDDLWEWFMPTTNRFHVNITLPDGEYDLVALCDKFINALYWPTHINTDKSFIVHNGNWGNNMCRISFVDKNCASLAEWTQFVSENNLIVYHRLLNPTYEKITDTTLISQLEALRKAKWFKGVNHWWTETENLEPNLKGTYKQSNNLRIKEQDERLDNLESRLALLE